MLNTKALQTIHKVNLMHKAITSRQVERVRQLLEENPSLLNKQDQSGQTALFVAVKQASMEIINYLLAQEDIDLEVLSNSGKTAVLQAAQNGRWEIVDRLLSAGAIDEALVFPEETRVRPTWFIYATLYTLSSNLTLSFLHVSASKGYLNIVKSILNKSPELINKADRFGVNVLCWAVAAGEKEMVSYLLEHRANAEFKISIAAKKPFGKTPLETAVIHNHAIIVEMLQTAGVTYDNDCIFELAVTSGSVDVVKQSLEKNPSLLNKPNQSGQTALFVAAHIGYATLVTYLLTQKNIHLEVVSSSGKTALLQAAQHGRWEIVDRLLGAGAIDEGLVFPKETKDKPTWFLFDFFKKKSFFLPWSFLHVSASFGRLNIVKNLLKKSPESINIMDGLGLTMLYWAATNNQYSMVSYLLENGADPVLQIPIEANRPLAKTALEGAVEANHTAIVELLQADINKNRDVHCFFAAAKAGSVMDVQRLLEQKSNLLNQTDAFGQTALCYAAALGHQVLVQYFILLGADINLLNHQFVHLGNNIAGKTPIQVAVEAGHKEIMMMLIDARARYKALDLMHLAVCFGRLPIVTYFFENNNELLNKKNKRAQTALFLAVDKGQDDVVEYLLTNGAEMHAHACLSNGPTLIEYAKAKGLTAIAKKLEAREPTLASRIGLSISYLLSGSMFATLTEKQDAIHTDTNQYTVEESHPLPNNEKDQGCSKLKKD